MCARIASATSGTGLPWRNRLWSLTHDIFGRMRFEKIWVSQCKATKRIRRRFGPKSALDYLIREKLLAFAEQANEQPEFAKELPRFLAAVWQLFNQYELAGYVAYQKPTVRKTLRKLLYVR